jgi:hypothetical protein
MRIIITEEQEELLKNKINDLIGKKVMCYYDLHRHTFSVTYKGLVMLKADYLRLSDVEFRVRQGGKQKVRNEQRKNVHAFVIGYLDDYCEFPCDDIPEPDSNEVITYNPYKYDTFVVKSTEEPIYKANEIEMINIKDKIFLIN